MELSRCPGKVSNTATDTILTHSLRSIAHERLAFDISVTGGGGVQKREEGLFHLMQEINEGVRNLNIRMIK